MLMRDGQVWREAVQAEAVCVARVLAVIRCFDFLSVGRLNVQKICSHWTWLHAVIRPWVWMWMVLGWL